MNNYTKLHQIETPLGNVYALPQGRDPQGCPTLYVQLEHDFQREYSQRYTKPQVDGNPDRIHPVMIRKKEYRGTFHAHVWSDGTVGSHYEFATDGNYRIIEPRRPCSHWDQTRNLYLYECEGFSQDASVAAKDTFIAKALPAIANWVKAHPEVIQAADIGQLEAEIESEEDNIQKQTAAIQDQMQKLGDKKQALIESKSKLESMKGVNAL